MKRYIKGNELLQKIQKGDLIYRINSEKDDGHNGWSIYIGDEKYVGLNTRVSGSWGRLDEENFYKIKKYIPISEVEFCYQIGDFLHSYDENDNIGEYIYLVEHDAKTEDLMQEAERIINNAKEQLDKLFDGIKGGN